MDYRRRGTDHWTIEAGALTTGLKRQGHWPLDYRGRGTDHWTIEDLFYPVNARPPRFLDRKQGNKISWHYIAPWQDSAHEYAYNKMFGNNSCTSSNPTITVIALPVSLPCFSYACNMHIINAFRAARYATLYNKKMYKDMLLAKLFWIYTPDIYVYMYIPLNMPKPWQARFSCRDSDYF